MLHILWDPSSPTRDLTKPLAVNAWNPNHWATREFPSEIYFFKMTYFQVLSYLLIFLKISNFQAPSSNLW